MNLLGLLLIKEGNKKLLSLARDAHRVTAGRG